MPPGPPVGIGTPGLIVVIVGAGAGLPPGPPLGIGTLGLMEVMPGPVGGMGVTGDGTGVPGTMGLTGVPPLGAGGGASAAMLLVRKVTFAPRAFNALGVGAEMPPAAGSISSSQAPHSSTEST